MKKYTWNQEELRNNIDFLMLMECMKLNHKDQKLLNENIDSYISMLKMANKRSRLEEFYDDYSEYELVYIIEMLYSEYGRKNKRIINLIFKAMQHSIIDYQTLTGDEYIRYTNEQLIDLARDFIISLDNKDLINSLNEVVDNDKLCIKYSKDAHEYAGITLYDKFNDSKFIYVGRNNRMRDLSILPHELFHYTFAGDNQYEKSFKNSDFLGEVEGTLSNILFADYYNKTAYDNRKYFIDANKIQLTAGIKNIFIMESLIESLDSNMEIRFDKLNKKLGKYGININSKEEIKENVSDSLNVEIEYSFSDLIALDLYYIYLEDKEKCFYFLKRIKAIKNKNNIIPILKRNGISFLKDDYLNLQKYLKR